MFSANFQIRPRQLEPEPTGKQNVINYRKTNGSNLLWIRVWKRANVFTSVFSRYRIRFGREQISKWHRRPARWSPDSQTEVERVGRIAVITNDMSSSSSALSWLWWLLLRVKRAHCGTRPSFGPTSRKHRAAARACRFHFVWEIATICHFFTRPARGPQRNIIISWRRTRIVIITSMTPHA